MRHLPPTELFRYGVQLFWNFLLELQPVYLFSPFLIFAPHQTRIIYPIRTITSEQPHINQRYYRCAIHCSILPSNLLSDVNKVVGLVRSIPAAIRGVFLFCCHRHFCYLQCFFICHYWNHRRGRGGRGGGRRRRWRGRRKKKLRCHYRFPAARVNHHVSQYNNI